MLTPDELKKQTDFAWTWRMFFDNDPGPLLRHISDQQDRITQLEQSVLAAETMLIHNEVVVKTEDGGYAVDTENGWVTGKTLDEALKSAAEKAI